MDLARSGLAEAQREEARDAAGHAASLDMYLEDAGPAISEMVGALVGIVASATKLVESQKQSNAALAQFHALGGDPGVRPLDGVTLAGQIIGALAANGITVANLMSLRFSCAESVPQRMALGLVAAVLESVGREPGPHAPAERAQAEIWARNRKFDDGRG